MEANIFENPKLVEEISSCKQNKNESKINSIAKPGKTFLNLNNSKYEAIYI